jgi:ubiquilin
LDLSPALEELNTQLPYFSFHPRHTMADDTAADEAPVTFNIKSSSDAKYVVTVPLTMTVLDLKQKLSASEYADIPPDRQRLIYSGRVLKDPDALSSYKIKEGNTVHLVKGAASNQRQNPANSSTTTANAGSTPGNAGVPTNIAAGTGNNPLAGLTGARYAGFAQLPGADMFGPDGGVSPPPSYPPFYSL